MHAAQELLHLWCGCQAYQPFGLSINEGDNIDAEPFFVDAGNEDFHPQPASSGLDAGMSSPPLSKMPDTDNDGNARIADGNGDGILKIDMGTYELQVPLRNALKLLITGYLISIVVAVVPAGASTITQTYGVFDVTFYNAGESNGIVSGRSSWTAEQMADVGSAVMAWDRINNESGRNIRVHAFWNELDVYGRNVLGGSASYRIADGQTIWNLGEYVWKEGMDPGKTSYGFDTIFRFDVGAGGTTWNFGEDLPGATEIDFRTVVSHEIGHSLGWDSSYSPATDTWGWLGDVYGGLTAWDANLVDAEGDRPASGGTGTPGNFIQDADPVYFDGPSAASLYGGPVPIFAPSSYLSGASLLHLDEEALGSMIMTPYLSIGEYVRDVSELEWAMMADMGWDVNPTDLAAENAPIPEPATLLLLGTGLAGLGATRIVRRKCRNQTN